MQRVRILAAGGCHLSGFGVGPQEDMLSRAAARMRSMSIEPEINVLAPVSLSKRSAVYEAISKYRPTIVLLQMGHYESTGRLASRLPGGTHVVKAAECRWRFAQTLICSEGKWLAKWLVHRVCCLELMGPAAISAGLRELFEGVREFRCRTILLAPFPTLDPVVNVYRKRIRSVIFELGGESGLEVVDLLWGLWTTPRHRRRFSFLKDGLHLNVEGHALAGNVLGRRLAGLCEELNYVANP